MPNPDFAQLRQSIDAHDPFMTTGHQIIQVRGGARTTPDWAGSNEKIQQLLLRSFPELKSSATQRKRAARWAAVIQLYYRAHMSKRDVAAHMNLNYNTVRMLVRNIKLAGRGMRSNGSGKLSNRPKGRPRKKC